MSRKSSGVFRPLKPGDARRSAPLLTPWLYRIKKRSDGTVRLVKVYDWLSLSYDDSLLKEHVLTVGCVATCSHSTGSQVDHLVPLYSKKSYAVTRGCVAFFFNIITGPRWHSMFK